MKNRNLKVSTMVVLFIAIVMGSTSCTDATEEYTQKKSREYQAKRKFCKKN